jgi:hypothetical protein
MENIIIPVDVWNEQANKSDQIDQDYAELHQVTHVVIHDDGHIYCVKDGIEDLFEPFSTPYTWEELREQFWTYYGYSNGRL